MKTIVKLMFFLCLSCLAAGCDDMNSVHQEYLDRGKVVYTGMVDSLKAFPGLNSVRFTWEIKSDPRITKTVIYWNEGEDSATVNVVRTGIGVLQMEKVLNSAEYPSISEGSYLFEFVTKDDKGHRSLGVEKSVDIYGDKYLASLQCRPMESMTLLNGRSIKITWLPEFTSMQMQYSTVRYMDTDGEEKIDSVKNEDSETVLLNVDITKPFSVVSAYRIIEDADVIEANPRVYTLDHIAYDKTGWTATALTSRSGDGSGPGGVIDGNNTTWWHNNYVNPPDWLEVDMKNENLIKSVEIYKRRDVKQVVVKVSLDGINWTEAGATEFPNVDYISTTVVFEQSVRARYIHIDLIDGYRNPYMSVYEITAYYDK